MYIGIDCGSVSMKATLLDDNKNIIKSTYRKNFGLIETIKIVLEDIKTEKKIKGVGITGSGREFISTLIGGDKIESEIIAHYIATTSMFPDVKTIFDIGGEDCKLIQLDGKTITNFVMNRDCGGGTGAMIESIANRMDINLDDIGDIALRGNNKIALPSKCGVFCQSAVVSKLNKGMNKSDILMGVCRGLIGNYFAMLGKGIKLQPPYVFQGATAKNKALLYCFEKELSHNVLVPKNPDLMGAIGVAIATMEEHPKITNFKGFNLINSEFETKTYFGVGCSNQCEITQIYENSNLIGYIGNRCEKCIKTKLLNKPEVNSSSLSKKTQRRHGFPPNPKGMGIQPTIL